MLAVIHHAIGKALAFVVGGLWLVAAPRSAFAEEEKDSRAIAQELFEKGNQAFAAGDTFAAHDAYLRAFNLAPTFDIACNLGRVEAELGKLDQSATHLRYCLKNFAASARPEMRKAAAQFRDLWRKVVAQLCEVEVEVSPDGTSVSANGTPVGSAPFSESVYLMPGTVTLVFSKPGYRDETIEFQAQSGSKQEMRLTLESDEVVTGTSRPTALAASPAPADTGNQWEKALPQAQDHGEIQSAGSPSWRTPLLISGSSVTLLGLGLGGFYAHKASEDHAAYRRKQAEASRTLGEPGCAAAPSAPVCRDLANYRRGAADKENVALAFLLAASGIGVGTFTTLLLTDPESPSRSGPKVSLRAGRKDAAVVVSSTF